MDNWQPATLSWSFSKKTHFDSCRRHYFYHRFWGQDPKLRWKLFEMRNLTTLTMLRGHVVHAVIVEALKSLRLGNRTDARAAKENVTAIIRELYAESAKKLWHIDNRPPGRKASEITSLLEHYYKFPNINQRARDAQQVGWACVENLMNSDFWAEIADAGPSCWVEMEDESFPSFDVDGIKVYTKIDLAHTNGGNTIIDWKTGSPSDKDRLQLTLYSMYAQSKWDWDPLQTKLCAVYLQPEFHVDSFSPTESDINAVKEEVLSSFGEMQEIEPAFGPADIALFPTNGAPRECHWCRFMGICHGDRKPTESAELSVQPPDAEV